MRTPLLSAALLAACACRAGEWHVSPKGDDANPGTRRQPFATLSRARDAIRVARQAGDASAWTVRVAEGVYPLSAPLVFEPADSGLPGAPVSFIGEGAGTRVIGGRPVTGWQAQPDGTWQAAIPRAADGTPAYFETLYVNGRRATRARHPDRGFLLPQAVGQTLLTNRTTRTEYALASLTARGQDLGLLAGTPQQDWRFAQVVVHHNWDTTRRMILGFDADTGRLHTQGGRWKPWNPWRTNSLYYVENVRAAFDAPGEWLYDGNAGLLRYRPLPGERLSRAEIFAPVPGLQTLVQLNGVPAEGRFVRHLAFRDLAFHYSDSPRRADQLERASLPPEVLGDLNRPGPTQFEPMQAAARTEAAIMADGAHDVTFSACEIAHTGEYGLWFRAGCVSNRIERCLFTDLGAGGIRIGDPGGKGASISSNAVVETLNSFSTAFNTVDNCIITRGGRFHASATAVWVGHSGDNRITHCEIRDHFYTGISVGWVWGYKGSVAQRNTVAFNRISKIGQGALGDMGGVYTLGTSFGTRVCNNVIFDVDSYTYGGWGLYPDEGSEGIVFENNLVHDTKDSSFHQHYGRDNVVRNNILCYSRECQIAISRVEPHRSAIIERNLIYWERGPAFSPTRYKNTDKARVDWVSNLWWCADGPVTFNGRSFAEWQADGRDAGGLVADPQFRDAAARDFRLRPASPAFRLGFIPFDPDQAGVYGDRAWRRRALTD